MSDKQPKCIMPGCNRPVSTKSKAGLCDHHLRLAELETAYLVEVDKKTNLISPLSDA